MPDEKRPPLLKEFIGYLPAVAFVWLVIGSSAVAIKTISDVSTRQDQSSTRQEQFAGMIASKLDNINTTLSSLPFLTDRVRELERGLRENTNGDGDQSREIDKIRSAAALDHDRLERLDKGMGVLLDRLNAPLPRGTGR